MKYVIAIFIFLSGCQLSPQINDGELSGEGVVIEAPVETPSAIQVNAPTAQVRFDIEATARYRHEIDQLCQEIGQKLGSVSTRACTKQGLTHSGAYSVSKRPLAYKDYSSSPDSPKVLVVGGTHGDEYSSYSLMFKWFLKLDQNTHGIYWRVIPALNPDGLLLKKAQRMNAKGVDINRNFPTQDWQEKALHYWDKKLGKDKRRYPGPTALSEPETRWLDDVINQWQPDVIVSVHAPYGILDFDAPTHQKHTAPSKLGLLHLHPLGTYPGSLGRYAGEEKEIPVLTIELAHAGIMPSPSAQETLWNDLVAWILNHHP